MERFCRWYVRYCEYRRHPIHQKKASTPEGWRIIFRAMDLVWEDPSLDAGEAIAIAYWGN